jgi:hypothetical protein
MFSQSADLASGPSAISGEISMRLTTSTATLAVAGLAALATGCSSSGQSASVPAVVHHAQPAAAKPAARPLSPRAALAKAVRATLAAHTVQFRYQDTVTFLKGKAPTQGVNPSPLDNSAGVANFDKDLVTLNDVEDSHANQPSGPDVVGIVDGDTVFAAPTDAALLGVWIKGANDNGGHADVLVSQVLQDTKGPVRVVAKSAGGAVYSVQSDLGQLAKDQSNGQDVSLKAALGGTTQTEQVWVNRDGLIWKVRWTIDPGSVHLSGLRSFQTVLQLGSYGVDMFVQPHTHAV